MKIIHVYGGVTRMHGATKWLMAFASELEDRGHDSRILCTEFAIPEPYWLTAGLEAAHAEPAGRGASGRVGRVLRNLARVLTLAGRLPGDVDVVVLHTEVTLPLLPLVRRRCRGARVVYYCYQPPRELYDLWDVVKRDLKPLVRGVVWALMPFYKAIDRALVRAADLVLVWSPEYREYARRIYGELDYVLVPAGVDFRMFGPPPAAEMVQTLRGGREHVLLMNASLTRKKNVDVFIDLLATLTRQGWDVQGIVVGEGPLYDELQAHARTMGVADRLAITGYVSQEDLPAYYHAADVLYYLEPNGAWTMSIIEAGAAHKPVIAAPGGSIPTLVRDGETGHVLRAARDVDDLIARTIQLLGDGQLSARMGERNHQHCRQFSLENSAGLFLDAVDQLEGRR